MKRRYFKIDGWRGYWIPGNAIAGASDSGTWSDSPCPTDEVKAEIRRFQRECLRPAGIKSRQNTGGSNAFCGKRWICVDPADFLKAQELAHEWLDAHKYDTQFLHDARGTA